MINILCVSKTVLNIRWLIFYVCPRQYFILGDLYLYVCNIEGLKYKVHKSSYLREILLYFPKRRRCCMGWENWKLSSLKKAVSLGKNKNWSGWSNWIASWVNLAEQLSNFFLFLLRNQEINNLRPNYWSICLNNKSSWYMIWSRLMCSLEEKLFFGGFN